MSTGQMIMVAVAMMLLGKLVVSSNETVAMNQATITESECIGSATAIGQSMIEKILVKNFDDSVATAGTPDSTKFSLIGLDPGEVAGNPLTFNDFDDYNGYVDSVDTPRYGKFYLTTRVYYVSSVAPYDYSVTKTYAKRIEVEVDNKFMVDLTGKDPEKLDRKLSLYMVVSYN